MNYDPRCQRRKREPEGIDTVMARDVPEMFERCQKLIAERRENPTDDLTSVLVHAKVDDEMLEEHEIVMGFFLLMAAGNDSAKATYCSAMRALLEVVTNSRCCSTIPDCPQTVERFMFPAFAHFRRTATKDTELLGQPIKQGEKVVMWYVSSNRDETVCGTRMSSMSTAPSIRPSAPEAGTVPRNGFGTSQRLKDPD